MAPAAILLFRGREHEPARHSYRMSVASHRIAGALRRGASSSWQPHRTRPSPLAMYAPNPDGEAAISGSAMHKDEASAWLGIPGSSPPPPPPCNAPAARTRASAGAPDAQYKQHSDAGPNRLLPTPCSAQCQGRDSATSPQPGPWALGPLGSSSCILGLFGACLGPRCRDSSRALRDVRIGQYIVTCRPLAPGNKVYAGGDGRPR